MRSGRRLGAASLATGVLLIGFASPSLADEVTGGAAPAPEGTAGPADGADAAGAEKDTTAVKTRTKARVAKVRITRAECDAAVEQACTPASLCEGIDKLPNDPRLCEPKKVVTVRTVAASAESGAEGGATAASTTDGAVEGDGAAREGVDVILPGDGDNGGGNDGGGTDDGNNGGGNDDDEDTPVECSDLPIPDDTNPLCEDEDPGNEDPGGGDPGNEDPGNEDPGNEDPGNGDDDGVIVPPITTDPVDNGNNGNGGNGNGNNGNGNGNTTGGGTTNDGGGSSTGPEVGGDVTSLGATPEAEVSTDNAVCSDPAVCGSVEPAVETSSPTTSTGPTLPDTGAPAHSGLWVASGLGLLLAGGSLLRPRKRAQVRS